MIFQLVFEKYLPTILCTHVYTIIKLPYTRRLKKNLWRLNYNNTFKTSCQTTTRPLCAIVWIEVASVMIPKQNLYLISFTPHLQFLCFCFRH